MGWRRLHKGFAEEIAKFHKASNDQCCCHACAQLTSQSIAFLRTSWGYDPHSDNLILGILVNGMGSLLDLVGRAIPSYYDYYCPIGGPSIAARNCVVLWLASIHRNHAESWAEPLKVSQFGRTNIPYLRSCEEHLTKMVESNVRSIQEQGARMLPTTWFGICSIQRNSILWMDQLADEQRIESLTTLELRDSMQYAFSSLIWFQRYRRKEQLHT